ncbi:hypothetical protein DAI22_03g289500 [Oryza sativa Japonica Group]|nr:hypothetical protein DAI22_03g289500 [Oryza sativa Japonica Group]
MCQENTTNSVSDMLGSSLKQSKQLFWYRFSLQFFVIGSEIVLFFFAVTCYKTHTLECGLLAC